MANFNRPTGGSEFHGKKSFVGDFFTGKNSPTGDYNVAGRQNNDWGAILVGGDVFSALPEKFYPEKFAAEEFLPLHTLPGAGRPTDGDPIPAHHSNKVDTTNSKTVGS